MLIKHGASVDAVNHAGRTPLEVAKRLPKKANATAILDVLRIGRDAKGVP